MVLTHYELLGVSTTATNSEIDRAYRNVSKAYHPDAGGPIANATLFREATEARDVLTDPGERRKYDDRLSGCWSEPTDLGDAQTPTPSNPRTSRAARPNGYATLTVRSPLRPRTPELLFVAILAYLAGHWATSFAGDGVLAPLVIVGRVLATLAPYLGISAFLVSKSKVRATLSCVKRLAEVRRSAHGSTDNKDRPRVEL